MLLTDTAAGEQDKRENERGHVDLTAKWRKRHVRSVGWKKHEDRLVNEDRGRSIRIETNDAAVESMPGSDPSCAFFIRTRSFGSNRILFGTRKA
jgi:hypothetical protein